ncbi:MAG TPA: hypothetical protein VFP34_04670 [Microlunatus sp.]|jgi:hypothetical protein|nr:hypothetical protein [Microlunatus sp.]
MPILTHGQTLIIGAIVAPALFAASMLLSGARGRSFTANKPTSKRCAMTSP